MSDPMTASEISQDEKTMAMIAAILGIPTLWLGPLIIYLIKKDQSRYIAFYALQSLILGAAVFVISFIAAIPLLGWLIYAVALIANLVLQITAAMAANRGEWHEIPVAGKYAKQQLGIA
jgi:hypothetical protein